MYCKNYNGCNNIYKTNKSFVEFECDYAKRNELPIIVLYNFVIADKSMCIDSIKDIAICHTPMKKRTPSGIVWDYSSVKQAFDKLNKA